ncbi:MAG TPA: transcription termination/antitermination protein NusG [Vampirovibrionales bacterium]
MNDNESSKTSINNLGHDGHGWYVVYTMGHEDKVKAQILKRAENMGVSDEILEIYVPKKVVSKVKSGKRVEQEQPRYQRYIFVNMLMNDTTFRVVRHTPGVLDVIDRPLSKVEVARLFGRISRRQSDPESVTQYKVDFQQGDLVKIEGGAFDGFEGEAGPIDLEHGKVTVYINIFGSTNPVDLTIDQVQPSVQY